MTLALKLGFFGDYIFLSLVEYWETFVQTAVSKPTNEFLIKSLHEVRETLSFMLSTHDDWNRLFYADNENIYQEFVC